ncbi:hypothetical protein JOQ06_009447 [Pogonophryne albipinna]|uniref:Uncharacterized protein n=1 Tax=Pogonophryne albipinna TaxID=1090488 RepID=A0AAD6BSA1_9TELE|nr:hypothetical protein JOQ06_009447 [Pogonophryne albipinna]
MSAIKDLRRDIERQLHQLINFNEMSPAQRRKEEPRLEKKTQTHIAEVDEDDSDSSDDEYTVQPVPCYRLVRPQQTEHRQAVHCPETQLRARACEFHPAVREETYTYEENPPPTQEGAAEDVAVEEEPQDRHMEGMVADEEGHQVEAETVRRSQRTARPREMFTYGTMGQPSYQQWNAGVNSLLLM